MSLNCPSCWSNLEIIPWLLSTVCKYCKTISMIERDHLVSTWEKSLIMPFPTVFWVGAYFYAILDETSNDKINWKKVTYISEQDFNKQNLKDYLLKIYVYGQIRYINDWWFFDDFFVRIIDDKFWFDKNKEYILGENWWIINLYIIQKIYTWVNESIFDSKTWTTWNNYFVQEVWNTQIEWFEWSFPFCVGVKDNNKYINLLKDWKQTQFKSIWNDILQFSWV